jgi:hypothetical protein
MKNAQQARTACYQDPRRYYTRIGGMLLAATRNRGEIAAQAWRTGIVTERPRVSPAWLQ